MQNIKPIFRSLDEESIRAEQEKLIERKILEANENMRREAEELVKKKEQEQKDREEQETLLEKKLEDKLKQKFKLKQEQPTDSQQSSKIIKMIDEIKKRKIDATSQYADVDAMHNNVHKQHAPIVNSADVATEQENVSCPTCHKHSLEHHGHTYKCTGPDCKKEFAMVDKDADYKCTGCGIPIKKPEKEDDIDSCPFCKGNRAIKFDWQKLWKKNNTGI